MSKNTILKDESEELTGRKQAIANIISEFDGKIPQVQDDEGVEILDPNVELQRGMIEMGMATGEYKDLILQVTNLDNPIQAISLAQDGLQLEYLRAAGMPGQIYEIISGRNMSMSGFFGFLRGRQGVLYPGPQGFDAHPRMQLFRSLFGKPKDDQKTNKTLSERISSLVGSN